MRCKCEPCEEHYPDNPERSVIYFIPCKFCGHHLYVRKRGDYSKIQSTVILPEGKPLNLKFDVKKTDYEFYKNHRDVLCLTKRDLSTEEMRVILYEMLADDEIDIDQFNNYSTKLLLA